jgi:hypothetical protein
MVSQQIDYARKLVFPMRVAKNLSIDYLMVENKWKRKKGKEMPFSKDLSRILKSKNPKS